MRRSPVLAAAVVLAAVVAVAATASAAPSPSATAAAARSCGTVNVKFGPSSETSATNIKSIRLRCSSARSRVCSCVKGVRPSGWRVTASSGRVTMRKHSARITFQLAGGGPRAGCIPL